MTRRTILPAAMLPVALSATLLGAACSQEAAAPLPQETASDAAVAPAPGVTPSLTAMAGEWEMTSSGEGDGLFFGVSEGEPGALHMFCRAGGGLLVNVPSFRPVGSEERMTLGSGGTVATLVADPAGDGLRGGVSGEGPVPAELLAILSGASGVAVNYGAQDLGPLPTVPAETARAFVAGCTD